MTALLVVVSGPPGTGKTTLSRTLGARVALPVICRDAIKEGVSHTTGTVVVAGTPEASRVFDLFYEVLDHTLGLGISVIAEAAFMAAYAEAELTERAAKFRMRHVRCSAPLEEWLRRVEARGERFGHRDGDFIRRTREEGALAAGRYFVEVPGVPTLDVDTSDGYDPPLDDVAAFVLG